MEPHAQLDPLTDDLLDRYLTGVTTPSENALVAAHLVRHPELASSLKRLSAFSPNQDSTHPWDVPGLWTDLVARLVVEARPETHGPRIPRLFTTPGIITPKWVIGVVAAIVLAAVGIQNIPWRLLNPGERSANPLELRTVSTRPGQHAQFRFADGSSAFLAPGTTLQYSRSYENGNRIVELDGEALFTIIHDDNAPFVVRTGGTPIRVLGTTFSVRRYQNDRETRVVVAQGKVAVAQHVLTSGDAAVVDQTGSVAVERDADIGSELAWTTGTLVFRKISMRDVIPELHRWYGLDVSVSDPALLDRDITATFLIDAPDKALNVLSILLRADLLQDGAKITFRRKQ